MLVNLIKASRGALIFLTVALQSGLPRMWNFKYKLFDYPQNLTKRPTPARLDCSAAVVNHSKFSIECQLWRSFLMPGCGCSREFKSASRRTATLRFVECPPMQVSPGEARGNTPNAMADYDVSQLLTLPAGRCGAVLAEHGSGDQWRQAPDGGASLSVSSARVRSFAPCPARSWAGHRET